MFGNIKEVFIENQLLPWSPLKKKKGKTTSMINTKVVHTNLVLRWRINLSKLFNQLLPLLFLKTKKKQKKKLLPLLLFLKIKNNFWLLNEKLITQKVKFNRTLLTKTNGRL